MSIDGTTGSEARDVAERLTALCEWVPTVASRDIPEPIVRRAATVLCDDIAAIVASQGFHSLRAPIQLVTAPHSPVPFARELERAYVPGPDRIESAIRAVMRD